MIGIFPFLAAFVAFQSPQRPNAPASPLDGATLRVLPNGLRLIIREQHSLPLVAIDAWVRAGSSHELAGEGGVAHFLEHMLFKGTANRKPGDVDVTIEDLGATLSAGTTRSGAHIFTTVSSRHAEVALEVTCDILRHATLDAAEMERERQVILDEIARSANDPARIATDGLFKLLGGATYSEPLLGRPEAIKGLSRNAQKVFYDRRYKPQNITIAIVGDVTPEMSETLIRKYLGDWKAGEQSDDRTSEGAPTAKAANQLQIPQTGQCVISVGTLLDGLTADEYPVARVIAGLLADGGFGRAVKAVSDLDIGKKSRRVFVDTDLSRLRNGGLLALYAICEADAASTVQKVLETTIGRVLDDPPSDAELDFARRRAEGNLLFEWETFAGQARTLAEFDVWGDFADGIRFGNDLAKVTRRQIKDFAKRFLTPEKIGVLVKPIGRQLP